MRVLLRFVVACLIGSLFGLGVRKCTTSSAKPALAVNAPARSGKDLAPAVKIDQSKPAIAQTKEERKEGIPAPIEPIYADTAPQRPLVVTGYIARGRKINVQLSDGRILTELDEEMKAPGVRMERNALHLTDGKRLFLMPAKRTEKAPEPVEAEKNQVQSSAVQQADMVASNPPPPADASTSWQMHSDGVLRLR